MWPVTAHDWHPCEQYWWHLTRFPCASVHPVLSRQTDQQNTYIATVRAVCQTCTQHWPLALYQLSRWTQWCLTHLLHGSMTQLLPTVCPTGLKACFIFRHYQPTHSSGSGGLTRYTAYNMTADGIQLNLNENSRQHINLISSSGKPEEYQMKSCTNNYSTEHLHHYLLLITLITLLWIKALCSDRSIWGSYTELQYNEIKNDTKCSYSQDYATALFNCIQ